MSNLLQTLKTVTLSHEDVLTALCALGAQRTKDQALLTTCAEKNRTWVRREIAMVNAAIAGLQSAAYAVRYCHACGHVGDVLPPARECCSNGHLAVMVDPVVAHQARTFHCVPVTATGVEEPNSNDQPVEFAGHVTLPALTHAAISTVSELNARTTSPQPKLTTWSTGDVSENGIVPLAATCFVLQLIHQTNIGQLVNAIHELAKTCHANAAVNITFIIAYADLHACHLHKFFSHNIQLQLVGDLPIEVRYLLAGEDGALHFFRGPSHLLSYVGKYFAKQILA